MKKINQSIRQVILIGFMILSAVPASAQFYLNRYAEDCLLGNGLFPQCTPLGGPFPTLCQAIEGTIGGSTLQIQSASYRAPARISKPMRLTATNGRVRISDGGVSSAADLRQGGPDTVSDRNTLFSALDAFVHGSLNSYLGNFRQDVTVAISLAGDASAFVTLGAEVGVFAQYTFSAQNGWEPVVGGLFVGGSYGLSTDVGVGGGYQVTVILGNYLNFAGDSVSLGGSINGGVVSAGADIILSSDIFDSQAYENTVNDLITSIAGGEEPSETILRTLDGGAKLVLGFSVNVSVGLGLPLPFSASIQRASTLVSLDDGRTWLDGNGNEAMSITTAGGLQVSFSDGFTWSLSTGFSTCP